MQEINGFKIEKYNQYGFAENAKTATCPICSKNRKPHNQKVKCAKIFWDTGLFRCFHCGEVGQLHTYKKKNNEKKKIYKKPEWKNNTKLSDVVVKYFENRKIAQSTLELMNVTESLEWMPKAKKIIPTINFNYFLDSQLVNIKFRGKNKDFKFVKDAEKIFYNIDNVKLTKECIVCEGEPDCLTWVQAGFLSTVSVPNGFNEKGTVNLSYLDDYTDYFDNKDKIYLSFDNDAAGQNGLKEFIRRMGAYRCYIIDLEGEKDANDYVKKYGYERLRQCKERAELVPIEGVKTFIDNKEALYDFYKNGAKRGHGIGIEEFDQFFTVMQKQYIAVTGIPSHGKSDFVDQMAVGWALNNDWKGAYCSVENDPQFLHIDKICRKIHGIRPKFEQLNSKEWLKTEEFVQDYFNFIQFEDGRYDLNKVLEKIKELVFRKGIKWFVLDPYNKIKLKESSGKNVVDYTNDYLNIIDAFCKEFDLVGVIVAHPIKPQKFNGIREEPDFYSIKGGGEWYDMSPHGLLVWRDFENDIVKVKVLKVKFSNLGKTYAEVFFKWNPKNGRYTPISEIINDEPLTGIWNFDNSNLLFKNEYEDPVANFNEGFEYVNSDFDFDNVEIPDGSEMPF